MKTPIRVAPACLTRGLPPRLDSIRRAVPLFVLFMLGTTCLVESAPGDPGGSGVGSPPPPFLGGAHAGRREEHSLQSLPLPGSSGASGSRAARSLWILAGSGAAALASTAFENEHTLAPFLEGSPLDGAMDFGNRYGDGLVWGSAALGLLAYGWIDGDSGAEQVGQELSLSLLTSWAAVWTLKLAVNARRPNGAAYSFPSGHTATAFAAAPVLARHCGRTVGALAYAAAASTALGRLEERRHHVADVLFAAGIGIAAGIGATGRGPILDHITVSPDHIGVQFGY